MTDRDKPDSEDDAAAAGSSQKLRQQAEARLLKKTALLVENSEALSPEAMRQVLHELHVHQIELEMQNEELRESQAALDAVRARYFDLYDLAPVGYCTVSEQGLIMHANLAAASLLGITRGALIKKPLSQFIVKADQDIYYLQRKKLLETGEPQSCELRMVKNNATQAWVHLAAAVAQDADGAPELRVVLNDISERKRTEVVTARLAAIVDSSDDAVISKDLRGIVVSWNRGAEKMFGYTASEIIGKPVMLLIPLERQTEAAEILGKIAHGESVQHFDTVRLQKDGSIINVDITVSPIKDEAGAIVGASKVARDVTERKRFEQMLQENNISLGHARSAADKANRAKSDFLSNMSHELRTPLNAILGFAQLMEVGAPPPTPKQKERIDQILRAGWYLLELVNEILDLALIESGKLSLSKEQVSLDDIMLECQAMIEPLAQKRGVNVTFPVFQSAYVVEGDHKRVKQIIVNLLSNAVKYNMVGGTVDVDYIASTPGRLRVCVTDTGAGLLPEKVAQLFQPFNRLGKEAGAEEGTGIGLVVSKRLVELMNGDIGVESTVGVGSMFWIELNLAAELPVARSAEPTAVSPAPVHAGAPLHTLLYVENNPANLMLVEELVARRPNIRMRSATDGNLGIEMARATQPDVILLDINLPDISGIQVLKILREDPATAHIPTVALSANAMPSDIEKGLQAGFFRYLTKPIKLNEFMETLDVAFDFAKMQTAFATKKKT